MRFPEKLYNYGRVRDIIISCTGAYDLSPFENNLSGRRSTESEITNESSPRVKKIKKITFFKRDNKRFVYSYGDVQIRRRETTTENRAFVEKKKSAR